MVVGGDGTMLRAIRQYWRRRVPFFGINTGHLGFLLNDSSQADPNEQDLVLYHLPLLAGRGRVARRSSAPSRWRSTTPGSSARPARPRGSSCWSTTTSESRSSWPTACSSPRPRARRRTPAQWAPPPCRFTPRRCLLVGSNVLHPPQWRPVVLPVDSRIEVRTHDPVKRPLKAFIDGIPQGDVQALHARVSNMAAVELAFLPNHDPSLKLAKLQFP